jgi:hypothetical protein
MKKYSAIIYIFIAVGIFFTFIDPTYTEVQALLEEKDKNAELIDKAEELRRKRQELTQKYNSISDQDIAGKYGIVLRGIGISGDISQEEDSRVVDRTDRKYGTINVNFNFSTTYSTMKRFMADLENSLRIVDISEFSVSASEQGDVYNYSISLDTYWLR